MGGLRRPTEEIRRLILDAATELFAAQGYARTSHRDIALKAGTAESLIYRNFGTKAELFRQAVLDPFSRHLEEYSATWRAQLDDRVPDEEIFRLFIAGLYDLVLQHRKMLLALMAVSQFEGENGAGIEFDLSELLAREEEMLRVEARSRGWPEVDFRLATESTVSAIIGMGLLDPWMHPAGKKRPSRARIIDELVALCFVGITRREV